MYIVAAHESTCDTTKIVTKHKKVHVKLFDSKDGITFWTMDLARGIKLFTDFPWDDTLVHVNEMRNDRARRSLPLTVMGGNGPSAIVSGCLPSRGVTDIRARCGTTVERPMQGPAVVVDSASRVGQIGLRLDQSCTGPSRVNSSITGDPLMVVYWNVAGIAAANIDQFLFDMEKEVKWDVLILIEFSAARGELLLSGVRKSGHLVRAQPYSIGRRAGALIFHARLRIHHVELISHGRAFGADFCWGGWRIRVVGGHADAAGDRRPYQQSIDDMEFIIESTPHNQIVIVGADI